MLTAGEESMWLLKNENPATVCHEVLWGISQKVLKWM